jgi:thiol-disulfide isomerase/thioredoxin
MASEFHSLALVSLAVSMLAGCDDNRMPPSVPAQRTASAEKLVPEDAQSSDRLASDENLSDVKVAQAPVAESAAAGDSTITLKIASWEEAQQLIAKQPGKVVVLDLWSTWCEPCVKEFPHLIALQNKHPDDVVCVSFNCNYIGTGKPDDEQPAVLDFLKQKKAAIVNLLSSDADEDLYKKVGIASIPVVQVYGRDGKLAKQFDNEKEEFGKQGFDYEHHIEPLVADLVKSGR